MGLVYPCFCSRSQLHAASAPHTSDGNVIYPGTCRGLTAEEIAEKRKKKAPAYRLMVPDENIAFTDGCMGEHTENLLRDCGDFYLRRADGVFAVSAGRRGGRRPDGCHRSRARGRPAFLYGAAALSVPASGSACTEVRPLPSAAASDGRRLSKRDGDQSLENLRARYTAEDIVGRLAYAYGLQEEPAPRTPESSSKTFRGIRCRRKTSVCRKGCFSAA